ncbi:MAG: PQQ-like beta-propeller repeat protein [Sphingobacteriales bacterium JAD_PAG50586_3]|nr:MAG: PQQ-like beta-propeller repeat protein [Sphingobacteriales bacterium JAD_PAG50586_3]
MKRIVTIMLVLATTFAKAQSGAATNIGPEGAWSNVVSATILNDKMYTGEKNGAIYETDLVSTLRTPIGKNAFDKGKFIFAANNMLYVINYEGTMFKVNATTGASEQLGIKGTWSQMYAYAVCKDQFYAVNSMGALTVTDLKTNTTREMGSTYVNVSNMFATADKIYLLEQSGKLHEMSSVNGAQKMISPNNMWSGILCGTGYKGGVYMIDKIGNLYALATGSKSKMGKAEFSLARFLLGANDNLYFIESTGSLYEIKL